MSVHNDIDDFPNRPSSACMLAYIVDNLQHTRDSICGSRGEPCALEDWKVGLIVTNIRNLRILQTESFLDAVVGIEFIVQILVEFSDTEFLCPPLNNFGHSSCDDTDWDAEFPELEDPVPVFHVEFLELFSPARIVKASVGHDTVDVKKEKSDTAKR